MDYTKTLPGLVADEDDKLEAGTGHRRHRGAPPRAQAHSASCRAHRRARLHPRRRDTLVAVGTDPGLAGPRPRNSPRTAPRYPPAPRGWHCLRHTVTSRGSSSVASHRWKPPSSSATRRKCSFGYLRPCDRPHGCGREVAFSAQLQPRRRRRDQRCLGRVPDSGGSGTRRPFFFRRAAVSFSSLLIRGTTAV